MDRFPLFLDKHVFLHSMQLCASSGINTAYLKKITCVWWGQYIGDVTAVWYMSLIIKKYFVVSQKNNNTEENIPVSVRVIRSWSAPWWLFNPSGTSKLCAEYLGWYAVTLRGPVHTQASLNQVMREWWNGPEQLVLTQFLAVTRSNSFLFFFNSRLTSSSDFRTDE